MATTTPTLGAAFAEALTAKDFERVAGPLHPEVDFRALTPNRTWEAGDPQHVVDDVLREWLDEERDGQIGWMRLVCSGMRAPG